MLDSTIVTEIPDTLLSLEHKSGSSIKGSIVTESVSVVSTKSDTLQIKFVAILQSFDVLNRNGRIYPRHKMQEAVNQLMHFVENRELLGELGHPEYVVSPERLFVIHPQHVSHRIEKIWIEGNLLFGEVVTTGPKGQDLARLILDGNNIGFSGRIYVSKWDRDPETGAIRVSDDAVVRIITYDAVIIPSHKEAYTKFETVTKVSTETFSHLQNSIKRILCTDTKCSITTENTILPGTIADIVLDQETNNTVNTESLYIPSIRNFTLGT